MSGFAPFMFRGQLQAGYCILIESVERRRGAGERDPWQDEGGEA